MINERRIREAIRVMTEVRDGSKPFDMSDWFLDYEPDDCGTPACFGGWLTRDPYFKALGMRGNPFYILYNEVPDKFPPSTSNTDDYGLSAEYAIAKLFDISTAMACSLVYRNNYSDQDHVSPQMVIDKLEALLNE